MATFLQDGCYSLHYVVHPCNEIDEGFIEDWAEALFTEYSAYIDEPFILRLGEYAPGSGEYSWLVEVRSTDPKTQQSNLDLTKFLIEVKSEQHYFGRNHEDPSENYAGRVDVAVIMPERNSPGFGGRTRPAALLLGRLAFAHYYEKITQHYLAWTSDYLDAPQNKTNYLGICRSLDDLWQ